MVFSGSGSIGVHKCLSSSSPRLECIEWKSDSDTKVRDDVCTKLQTGREFTVAFVAVRITLSAMLETFLRHIQDNRKTRLLLHPKCAEMNPNERARACVASMNETAIVQGIKREKEMEPERQSH